MTVRIVVLRAAGAMGEGIPRRRENILPAERMIG